MRLTVAICTWNRSALLAQALAALAACRVPSGVDWEVLVVANQCGDDTACVVRAAARALPVRLVVEPLLGLSHARNAAVAAARGTYILWIDDDVVVDPGWLEAYAAAFAADPDAAFFGGPIRAWFERPPPPWLGAALPVVASAYSLLDFGPQFAGFDADTTPFGANYVVRADVQRRFRYDPTLGRRGEGLRSGEETAVLTAILAEGGRGGWVPGAGVRHWVSTERQTLRHLRAYYFNNGASAPIAPNPRPARNILGQPLWLWAQALEHELRYWLLRPIASPARWARHLRLATTAWGHLYGAAVHARRLPRRRERRRAAASAKTTTPGR